MPEDGHGSERMVFDEEVKRASMGSLFHIFAMSPAFLPCKGSNCGLLTTPMRTAQGPEFPAIRLSTGRKE